MSKRIYLTIGALVVLLCGLFLFRGTEPVVSVEVSEGNDADFQSRGTLRLGKAYYVRVSGDTVIGGGISWSFTKVGNEEVPNYEKDNPRPRFPDPQVGTYIVRAFRDQREVARDTLVFIEGERAGVEWPPAQAEVGVPITATDKSIGARGRRWSVWEGVQVQEADTGKQLAYTPKVPGELRLWLTVEMPAGDTTLEHVVQVAKPLPKKVVEVKEVERRPVEVKEVRKEKKKEEVKEVKKPVEVKKVEPAPYVEKGDCFGAKPKASATSKPSTVVLVPKPESSEGSAGNTETIIEVTPQRDCQLASFQYWADRKGDGEVVFECMAPQCKGPKVRGGFSFPFGDDRFDPQKKELTNAPVLRAGVQYRIRVKAPPGMGVVGRSEATIEKDGVQLSFPQGKSTVFQLAFRVL